MSIRKNTSPKQEKYHWIPHSLVNMRKLISYLEKFRITSTNVFSWKYITQPTYESLQLEMTALRKNFVMAEKRYVLICSRQSPELRYLIVSVIQCFYFRFEIIYCVSYWKCDNLHEVNCISFPTPFWPFFVDIVFTVRISSYDTSIKNEEWLFKQIKWHQSYSPTMPNLLAFICSRFWWMFFWMDTD